jgi:acyl carrier protein
MDVQSTVIDIIASKANVESASLSPATELAGLALDSLDIVETIFQIEETFDISLPYNANQAGASGAPGLVTVGDVIKLVSSQIRPAHAPG